MRKQHRGSIVSGVMIICALAFGTEARAGTPTKPLKQQQLQQQQSQLKTKKGSPKEDLTDSRIAASGRVQRVINLRTKNFEDDIKTYGTLAKYIDGMIIVGHPVDGDVTKLSKQFGAHVVSSPQQIGINTIYDKHLYRAYRVKSAKLPVDMIKRRLGSEVVVDLHRDNMGTLTAVDLHDKK